MLRGRVQALGAAFELTAGSAAGAQGWQGVQTLPRVVTLDHDTPAMIMAPPAEIEGLRLAQLYDAEGIALDGPNNARARSRVALRAKPSRPSDAAQGHSIDGSLLFAVAAVPCCNAFFTFPQLGRSD